MKNFIHTNQPLPSEAVAPPGGKGASPYFFAKTAMHNFFIWGQGAVMILKYLTTPQPIPSNFLEAGATTTMIGLHKLNFLKLQRKKERVVPGSPDRGARISNGGPITQKKLKNSLQDNGCSVLSTQICLDGGWQAFSNLGLLHPPSLFQCGFAHTLWSWKFESGAIFQSFQEHKPF